jgi:predicted secreted protein
MAAIAGKGGSARLGVNTIAEVTSWSMDIATDMLDSSSLGDSWREFVAGLNGATGSVEVNWDVVTDANGQAALQTAVLAGTTVTLDLYVNATKYYSGTAYVSNFNVSDPVDDLVTATFDAQFSGAVTYN